MEKTISLLCLILLGTFNWVNAQITEEERSMTQGMNTAMVMTIPNADDKEVEKLWKKFMKTKDAKTKKIKKSEEWLSAGAEIPSVGGATELNVYATFEQSGGNVRMTTWVDMGGAYLNSQDHPERYRAGEDFLNAFELEVYKNGVRKEVKLEENNLKKLTGELKKLKKNNDRYHKEIENAKKKIAKMEANIEENIVEQEEANARIEAQKGLVEKTRRKLDVREEN